MLVKIVILGAGITGCLAKILIPDAQIYESKSKDAVSFLQKGVRISIVAIPELENKKYTRRIYIDNKTPTANLILLYKSKIERDGDVSYGDYRQFEPEQTVYAPKLPNNLSIIYSHPAIKIYLEQKTINFPNLAINYDYLISTIPLLDFIRLTDLFNHFKDKSSSLFMHRPIYMVSKPCLTEDHMIIENYITDKNNPIYRENLLKVLRTKNLCSN